jgi:hypothetical protein
VSRSSALAPVLSPRRGPTLAALVILALATGCGASRPMHMASAPMAASEAMPPPVPLDRSLFARDPGGQLTEEALQKILAAPIELDLPARVGVVPVLTATDWRGPSPDYQVPAGVAPFVTRLRGSEPFTLVTEIMAIPSGALGMEALREVAARYQLRYVILYREVLKKERRLNKTAWSYVTGVGALVAPGQRHQVYGYVEATLFDVKTGLLLFTTRRAVNGSRDSNVWYQDHKLDQLRAALLTRFAPSLADDVKADLYRFADAALIENRRRGVPTLTPSLPTTPMKAADPTLPTLGLAEPAPTSVVATP